MMLIGYWLEKKIRHLNFKSAEAPTSLKWIICFFLLFLLKKYYRKNIEIMQLLIKSNKVCPIPMVGMLTASFLSLDCWYCTFGPNPWWFLGKLLFHLSHSSFKCSKCNDLIDQNHKTHDLSVHWAKLILCAKSGERCFNGEWQIFLRVLSEYPCLCRADH